MEPEHRANLNKSLLAIIDDLGRLSAAGLRHCWQHVHSVAGKVGEILGVLSQNAQALMPEGWQNLFVNVARFQDIDINAVQAMCFDDEDAHSNFLESLNALKDKTQEFEKQRYQDMFGAVDSAKATVKAALDEANATITSAQRYSVCVCMLHMIYVDSKDLPPSSLKALLVKEDS